MSTRTDYKHRARSKPERITPREWLEAFAAAAIIAGLIGLISILVLLFGG